MGAAQELFNEILFHHSLRIILHQLGNRVGGLGFIFRTDEDHFVFVVEAAALFVPNAKDADVFPLVADADQLGAVQNLGQAGRLGIVVGVQDDVKRDDVLLGAPI